MDQNEISLVCQALTTKFPNGPNAQKLVEKLKKQSCAGVEMQAANSSVAGSVCASSVAGSVCAGASSSVAASVLPRNTAGVQTLHLDRA